MLKKSLILSGILLFIYIVVLRAITLFYPPLAAPSAAMQLSDSAVSYGTSRWIVEGGLESIVTISFLLLLFCIWWRPLCGLIKGKPQEGSDNTKTNG